MKEKIPKGNFLRFLRCHLLNNIEKNNKKLPKINTIIPKTILKITQPAYPTEAGSGKSVTLVLRNKGYSEYPYNS
jgi:hypothetical protein